MAPPRWLLRDGSSAMALPRWLRNGSAMARSSGLGSNVLGSNVLGLNGLCSHDGSAMAPQWLGNSAMAPPRWFLRDGSAMAGKLTTGELTAGKLTAGRLTGSAMAPRCELVWQVDAEVNMSGLDAGWAGSACGGGKGLSPPVHRRVDPARVTPVLAGGYPAP